MWTISQTVMDKKLTTTLSVALGATLLVGAAGYGLYKFIRNKRNKGVIDHLSSRVKNGHGHIESFIGNSLVKGNSLYKKHIENGLVGGGLTKSPAGLLAVG